MHVLVRFLVVLVVCPGAFGTGTTLPADMKRCFPLQRKSRVVPSNFDLPKLRIAWGYWETAAMTTAIAGILLREKLGFDIEFVNITARASYEAIAKGDVHLSFEAWTKSNPGQAHTWEEYDQDKEAERGKMWSFPYRELFGRSGLFEACSRHDPDFHPCLDKSLSQSPVLLDEALLIPSVQKHFSQNHVTSPALGKWEENPRCRAGNCTVQVLHIAPTGYDEGLIETLVEQLGIPAEVVYLGAQAHDDALWAAYTRMTGALMYSYVPNSNKKGISITALPRAPFDQNLDFPPQQLTKMGWPGLQEHKGLDALHFVRDFQLDQSDYQELANRYAIIQDATKVACLWIQENPSKWQHLIKFPERAKAPLFCLTNERGLCDHTYWTAWAVLCFQILAFFALLWHICHLEARKYYITDSQIRLQINQALADLRQTDSPTRMAMKRNEMLVSFKITVVSISDFPATSGFMDKTDPFVELILGQNKFRTSTKKDQVCSRHALLNHQRVVPHNVTNVTPY